jgi:dihydroorotate dehydrogenase (NAD+) catalytic subunit
MPSPLTAFYDPDRTFDDNFDNGPFPSETSHTDHSDNGEPAYNFLGHPLYSPFGVAAGPLPTSKHVQYAFDRGFDVVCYKTQRSVYFPPNDFPNIVYLDVDGDLTLEKAAHPVIGHPKPTLPPEQLTITNSFGNPSRGPDFWTEDLKKVVGSVRSGQLLIVSVVGTIQESFGPEEYYNDFAFAAELAAKAGAPVIEVNLSCPNVANEGILCYTPDAVSSICRKIKDKIGDTPLVAKIGYFSNAQQPLLEQIIQDNNAYIAAFSAINTIPVPVVDDQGKQLLPGVGRLKSGACGASIKWAGLDMVTRLAAYRRHHGFKYEIIGVGGVMSAADFQAYRKAGADVVQSATGAMWNPNLATEVKASLA